MSQSALAPGAPQQHDGTLAGIVDLQLRRLCEAAGLGGNAILRMRRSCALLTAESLAGVPQADYQGLSHINADGFPFQWSLCIDGGPASVRFLCETGTAGTSARDRCALARWRLRQLCATIGTPYPQWMDDGFFSRVLPADDAWPAQWQSAVWFALAARGSAVQAKVYVNLDRGDSASRWRNVGWVLKALGRERSLAQWCDLSTHVSRNSWLSGLAVDLRPDGSAGRVKAYFRSGSVELDWLVRWYAALGARNALRDVQWMLTLLGPHAAGPRFPDKSFFVSVEFSADEEASLKTDLPVCRWSDTDAAVTTRVRQLLHGLSLPDAFYLRALDAMDIGDHDGEGLVHQLIGLGFEPDGARHVNIYCRPPTPGARSALALAA